MKICQLVAPTDQKAPAPSHRYRSKHKHPAPSPRVRHPRNAPPEFHHRPHPHPLRPHIQRHILISTRIQLLRPMQPAVNKVRPHVHQQQPLHRIPPPPAQSHASAAPPQTPAQQNSHAESRHNAAPAYPPSPSNKIAPPVAHRISSPTAPPHASTAAAIGKKASNRSRSIASAAETCHSAGPIFSPSASTPLANNSPAPHPLHAATPTQPENVYTAPLHHKGQCP
jgi:hypothetical protein